MFASSDHGFAPQWLAINARKILFDTKVRNTVTGIDVSLHPSGNPALGSSPQQLPRRPRRRPGEGLLGRRDDADLRQPDPAGRDHRTRRSATRRRSTPSRASSTRQTPGRQVILKIMKKEELRNVDGTDALHPNRSGDVVVVSRPPYQFDAATAGPGHRVLAVLRPARLPAGPRRPQAQRQHARRRSSRAGPGIRTRGLGQGRPRDRRRADAVFLLGIPGPQNARGKILYNILEGTGNLRELTVLNISDWHAQLIPLTEAADTVGPDLQHRRLGVPEAVVRRLPQGGAGRLADADRRRLVRRRHAADLERVRRQADAADHEPDGRRRRGRGQPPVRPR